MELALRGTAVTGSLAVIAASLVLLNVLLQVVRWTGDHHNMLGLLALFDLDREQNIPTLFSTCLLLFSALLLAARGALSRAANQLAVGWFGLAALFAVLAVDEAWSLHERAVRPVRGMLPDGAPVWTHFAWVIPGALFATIVAATYLGFLRRLAPTMRNAIVTAACVYLAGALGMELISGAWVAAHGQANLGYALLATLEEGLELAGLVLFVRALLNDLTARGSPLTLRFR